jgi:hypothetical protein
LSEIENVTLFLKAQDVQGRIGIFVPYGGYFSDGDVGIVTTS